MNSGKVEIAVICAVALGSLLASLAIRGQAQPTLERQETMLRQQAGQIAELMAEHQRLSNLVARVTNPAVEQPQAELETLRGKALALRKQADELARQAAPSIRPPEEPRPSATDFGVGHVESDSNSEEYQNRLFRIGAADPHAEPAANNDALRDAQNLGSAAGAYAREHEGHVPSSFDQLSDYFFKDYRPPRTSDFEMVYQGSLDELTNIPASAVALVREREPWPTPAGKWARIYVMTGGYVHIVESDDAFRSWETLHLVPPATTDRH